MTNIEEINNKIKEQYGEDYIVIPTKKEKWILCYKGKELINGNSHRYLKVAVFSYLGRLKHKTYEKRTFLTPKAPKYCHNIETLNEHINYMIERYERHNKSKLKISIYNGDKSNGSDEYEGEKILLEE